MNAFRSAVSGMQGYTPGEQPQGRRYIKLNTNENPYPPSPGVMDAVRAALTSDLRLYPDPTAGTLRGVAAELYGIEPDRILAGNGSDELLSLLMRACVDPGDRVAYPVPTYSLYDTLVAIQGGVAVRFPFTESFRLPAALAKAGARLTFVCNPNSPSGTLVSTTDLEALAGAIDGLLVVDEAYVDFAAESALPLLRRRDNVVLLRTLSKSYSLAGVRIGLALAAPAIIGELLKVKDSYNVNRMSITAGVAALRDQEWMRGNVDRIRTTRKRLIASLRGLGYQVPESQTNFVLARRPGVDQEPVYLGLKDRGILVRHFRVDGLQDALRITVGTDAEVDALLNELHQIAGASR